MKMINIRNRRQDGELFVAVESIYNILNEALITLEKSKATASTPETIGLNCSIATLEVIKNAFIAVEINN